MKTNQRENYFLNFPQKKTIKIEKKCVKISQSYSSLPILPVY